MRAVTFVLVYVFSFISVHSLSVYLPLLWEQMLAAFTSLGFVEICVCVCVRSSPVYFGSINSGTRREG